MKQRMYNTYFRIFRIKTIARILSICSYALLSASYKITKCFIKVIGNSNGDLETSEKELKEISNYTDTNCEIVNLPNNEELDLSIIVPVYNVEKYVGECLDSILNQKTKYKYELIIVNDGATDNSKQIVQNYTDERIVYIEQKNRGLSGARNTGLNNAKGMYVLFVDSDDVLSDGAIEELMDAVTGKDADVSIGGYYMFSDGSDTKQYEYGEDTYIEKNLDEIIFNYGYAWGKVFKRELFNKVRFPEGKWYEDTIICSVIFRECKSMSKIRSCVYGYRQNPQGITRTARKSPKVLDHLWVMEDAINQAHKCGLKDDEYLYGLAFNHLSSLLYRRISLMDKDVKREAFEVARGILRSIDFDSNNRKCSSLEKDIQYAFDNDNYLLWKWASFVI